MMNAFEEKKKNNHILWKNTFPIPLVVLKKTIATMMNAFEERRRKKFILWKTLFWFDS